MQEQPEVKEEIVVETAEKKAEATPAEDPQAKIDQLKDQLMRALADMENLKKRSLRETHDMAKYAISEFAKDLLAVSDNLRRALEFAPEEQSSQVLEGVKMTEKELLKVFEKYGIRKVGEVGEKFDHNLHQAIFETEDAEKEPGTILSVMQPGYTIHDRLLRPAMVGVSKK